MSALTMDKLVALCKGRGFIYPGSEIYGGLANSWDYGPLGVELKNNVKRAWWQKFVQENKYNVGLDAAILMNREVWVASGHVGSFNDPLIDCKACKMRHRADKLVESYVQEHGMDVNVEAMTNDELVAFIRDIDREAEFENPDDLFPTIYRIDRIRSFEVLEEHFRVPYKDRFEEGEFRKRVQFMYGGRLQRIRFKYTGPSIEAVLDRLPTARIVEQNESGWTIQAEVFGKGIDMWLRSQGDYIEKVDFI